MNEIHNEEIMTMRHSSECAINPINILEFYTLINGIVGINGLVVRKAYYCKECHGCCYGHPSAKLINYNKEKI
jgi:hypothetical protein